MEKSIFNITQNQLRGGFQHINPIIVESLEKLEKINSEKGNVIGVPSGLIDLDDLTSGFQEGDLIIVAGRPGMGKTALALSMLRNAALDSNIGVGCLVWKWRTISLPCGSCVPKLGLIAIM